MDCCIPLTFRETKAGNSTLAYQRAVPLYRFWGYCLMTAELQTYIKEIRKASSCPTIQGLPCLSILLAPFPTAHSVSIVTISRKYWLLPQLWGFGSGPSSLMEAKSSTSVLSFLSLNRWWQPPLQEDCVILDELCPSLLQVSSMTECCSSVFSKPQNASLYSITL